MEKRKIGILCHGLHLATPNWQELVWGIPPYKLGRAPRAALLALEEKADLLVFGTGASEKDGVKEGAYTIDFLLRNFGRLREFRAFDGIALEPAKRFIASISVPEVLSQNTLQEVAYAGRIFVEKGVKEVRQVSSPFHDSGAGGMRWLLSERIRSWRILKSIFIRPPAKRGPSRRKC